MFILDATTKSLEAKLAGAPTTTQPSFVTSYVDVTTTTYVPGEQDGLTNGTTAVTVLSSPVSSTQRQLKLLTIRNQDTASVTLTLQYNNNSTIRPIWKGALAVDDTLVYTDGEGLRVVDSTGAIKGGGGSSGVPTSRLINTTAPLSGGGDLSADRTLVLTTSPASQTPVGVTRSVATTAPLSGGGDLSADRTLTTSMATNKLIGRGTAATGVMEEITLGTNLSFTGTTLNAAGGGGGGNLIYPTFTVPVNGDFAWVNQGSATVTVLSSPDAIQLVAPAQASNNLKIRKKSAPSTPYTITAALIPRFNLNDYATVGLLFRQSSDGKLASLALQQAGSTLLVSTKYNSATSALANYTTTGVSSLSKPYLNVGIVFYLRIADDGTNRIGSYSWDGVDFFQFHSVGRTDFLTADEVGFFAQGSDTTYTAGMTLLSWEAA